MAIMQVPVVKGKGVVEIDTDTLPEAVYAEAILQGLKTLVNRGMSKVTVKDLGDEEKVKAEAMIIAEQNVAKIRSGEIKFSGKAKASKVSGAVQTEAMRIARNRVKDALKAAGMKISYIKASDITAAAKELVASDDSIVAEATANIAKRAETPMPIDIKALVQEDSSLKAKGEAKKAAAKAEKQLSAKQAGIPAKGGKVPPRKAKPDHHTNV
jgi:hypothetical protein